MSFGHHRPALTFLTLPGAWDALPIPPLGVTASTVPPEKLRAASKVIIQQFCCQPQERCWDSSVILHSICMTAAPARSVPWLRKDWSLYLALEMAGPRWGTQPLTME